MLIATQGKNAAATRQYFETVLKQGDYYLGQEVAGYWNGKGAERLGLGQGTEVASNQFNALLNGQHPMTGELLAQRVRKDRRPGVDLTFSVPKSVSLAWAINQDEKIAEALRESVRETMTKDIEPLMMRRVRHGKNANTQQRTQTGELIYADFLHKTSRPVDGKPDPHLHIHAFVINWTFQNGKHYAGEFAEIIRQRPSLQAKFEARLARRLQRDLGYNIEKRQYSQSGKVKTGWEINGIGRETIEKFSRRTEQVEEFAKENGITDAFEKSKLGKRTRENKDKGTGVDKLREEWQSRLTAEERQAFTNLRNGNHSDETAREGDQARQSVKYALDHHLYRQSTVERHQVVGTALEHGVTLSPEEIKKTLDSMQVIQKSRDVEGAQRQFVTTREVLHAERDMIEFARDSRGTRKAIAKTEHQFSRDWLNEQQRDAVNHVLTSRDTVTAVTGGAGTGKSSLMQEAAEAIRGNGKEVFTFAPSTGAREVLQEKGFKNAQTVEYLLRNNEFQAKVKDQVLWIDEAGLLDVRSMRGLFKIANQQNARIVLSGDTRQHSSPRRGEAMRLLEREAGLNIARVETIQRQQGQYKQAVELISRGHEVDERTGKTGLLAGYDLLDKLGKIKEVDHEQRHELLASKYIEAKSGKQSPLIIAPTHAEAGAVTEKIRSGLREKGQLTEQEQKIPQLKSMNLSEAEKAEAVTYSDRDGLIVQFHQNVKGGFKRGERYRVDTVQDQQVRLTSMDGHTAKTLPRDMADRFEVYRESTLGIAVGDKVRFSLGGTAKDGKRRIANGRLDEVNAINHEGHLILKSGMTVDKNYGHLDLGYVITSHASQGKDRPLAIAAMGSESLPAINAKQFYVTVSRGRDDVAIYVDDKQKVRNAIARSGEQLSATELVSAQKDGPSQNREYDVAVRQQEQRGRNSFQNVRDRFVNWWKDQTQDRRATEPAVRPGPSFDLRMGVGMSPPPGRSLS
ncbi:MobF family relaxase [Thalassoglobus sp.]|uniref:MobF family relaxase n=1 Tax=Thalassoglobus sp. TaxID=2795869 RepID=UPI003AA81D34